MRGAILVLALVLAGSAAARAPETSPVPPPRPATEVSRAAGSPANGGPVAMPLRPAMQPGDAIAAASLVPLPRGSAAASAGGLFRPAGVAPPPPRPAIAAAPGATPGTTPRGNPGAAPRPEIALPAAAPRALASLPPPPRPQGGVAPPPAREAVPATLVLLSPRPPSRPAPGVDTTPGGVSLAAAFRTRPQRDLARPAPAGRLCGVRGIEGEVVAPIVSRVNGCGIAEPVRVRAVEGVRLSTGALMDCPTALALQAWVRDGVIPVIGNQGGGAASLTVGSHYACRTRNSQPGARISEHGRGRAIDISSIVLADGAPVTVLNGWRNARQGPILRALHRSACGTFGTVLGPDSDRFHRDHFHFDTARYRTGSFCR